MWALSILVIYQPGRECKYNGSICTSDPRTRASNHFLNYAQHAAFHTIVCCCSLTASIHAAQATPASRRCLCQTYAMIYAEQSTVHARTGILFLWRIGILFCFHCQPQKYRMTVLHLSYLPIIPLTLYESAVGHLRQGLGESFIAKCLQI